MTKRLAPLDGLRAIAVLLVFFSHTSGRGMYIHEELNFAGIGHVGVYLFFCLSAFLISYRLFTEKFNSNSIWKFYIKRFFRIIPLYYFVVTSIFIYQYFTGSYNNQYLHVSHGFVGYLQHLFMYRGDGVFWSVVVEEQFYLLVLLWIYFYIRFGKKAVFVFLLIALTNALLYSCKYLHWPIKSDAIRYITTNDRSSGNYIDIFIVGITFVWLFIQFRDFFERNRRTIIVGANILFFSMISLTLLLVSKNFLWMEQPFYKFRFLSVVYSLIFSLFIISLYLENPINKYLSNRFLCYIGLIGFSVYLLHMPVFQFVNYYIGFSHEIKFITASVLLLILASVSYYFIEKPFINISYKLIEKLKL